MSPLESASIDLSNYNTFKQYIKTIEVLPGRYTNITNIIEQLDTDENIFNFEISDTTDKITIELKEEIINNNNLIICLFQNNDDCNFFLNKKQHYIKNSIGQILGFKPINIIFNLPGNIDKNNPKSFIVHNYINIKFLYKCSNDIIEFSNNINNNICDIFNNTIILK